VYRNSGSALNGQDSTCFDPVALPNQVESPGMFGYPSVSRFRDAALATSVGFAIAGAAIASSASLPDSLLRSVPKDAVFAYFVAGPDAGSPSAPSSLGLASFLIERAHEFGLLSSVNEQTRIWLDVLASISDLLQYPHAVALLDIRAEPRLDGGHQLSGLHAALIIQADGGDARIEQRIQHLLSSYTNDEQTNLTSSDHAGCPVFTLRDRRLDDWVELTWGRHEGRYVVAIGKGSFDRIVQTIGNRTPGIAEDGWFANAWKVSGGADASLAALLRFDTARSATDDLLKSKIEQVQDSLQLKGVERGLWTVGCPARAIEAGAYLHRGGEDEWLPITRCKLGDQALGVIPDEASWYVILDVEPRALLDTLSSAYLASRSPDAQTETRVFWRNVEERVGLSIDRDIFGLLRIPIICHDYPRHALRLPLAWTWLFAVEDPVALRRHLDRVLEAAKQELAKEGTTQLRHDADGVWYLTFGIDGPALTVTDHWLIVSFSPDAVRKNIELLARHRRVLTTTSVP